MTLDEMNIQAAVKTEAKDLLRRIEQANGLLEFATVGGVIEGFLIGISCANAATAVDVDALDVIFMGALDRQMFKVG
jgi:hypothetical protein